MSVALRALVFLGLLASTASAAPQTVHVRAQIDGRSRLELAGDTVRWQHFDFAAPGRVACHLGDPIHPTTVDGVDWWPVWPDVPDCENRGCNGCTSDTWTGTPQMLPTSPFLPVLRNVVARGGCQIVEFPSAANGFTTVVEFDDNPIAGADFYEFDLEVTTCGVTRYCASVPNSTGQSAQIDVSGSLSVAANDTHLLASDCPAGSYGIFFYGSEPGAIPLATGTLCVSPFHPGFQRVLPICVVRPDGTVDEWLDMTALPAATAIHAGDARYFQMWFRDVTPSGIGTNLTDAVEVRFCP